MPFGVSNSKGLGGFRFSAAEASSGEFKNSKVRAGFFKLDVVLKDVAVVNYYQVFFVLDCKTQ